jgi:excisionase family DNA binding protein
VTDPPPITQHGDCVTIRGAPLLAATYRTTLAGIARRRADGLPSADLQQLARELYRAHTIATSRSRHELGAAAASASRSNGQDGANLIGAGEAAALLRLSRRQIQRLAADRRRGGLGGVRVGRAWAFDRSAVLALSERRDRDRRQLSSVMGPARDKPSDRAIT